ncbi:MAG: DNA recombination protein RmuC [SAR86 cluster bacterium]|jgi:DNA recombination protein RmuC|nr:DNA recombination protein RmuC [SAR86 cluster bacterium]PHS03796.1 MAG: DNA polymerase [Acidithiobacillus sp.]
MNLDLTILLVLALLALVGWNIYLSLGRRENKQEESRLNDIKTSLSSQSSSLEGLIRDVASFQDPLNKLNRYLSGGTLAGSFGEWSLEAIITDIFPPDKFETNCEIITGSGQRVEFAIKLPDGLLPIDAKFPSALYDNYIDASNRGEKDSVNNARTAIKRHVINDAKDIKEKYIQAGKTIDLGVMFIPSESLVQLIDSIEDLRKTVFRDSRVLVMGPNSLAAYLISIHMGFRNLALNERAEEILVEFGNLKKEFESFESSTEDLVKKAEAMVKAVDKHETRERQMNRALRKMEEMGEDTKEKD